MGGQGPLPSASLWLRTLYGKGNQDRGGGRVAESGAACLWPERESGRLGEGVPASESREWGLPGAGPEVHTVTCPWRRAHTDVSAWSSLSRRTAAAEAASAGEDTGMLPRPSWPRAVAWGQRHQESRRVAVRCHETLLGSDTHTAFFSVGSWAFRSGLPAWSPHPWSPPTGTLPGEGDTRSLQKWIKQPAHEPLPRLRGQSDPMARPDWARPGFPVTACSGPTAPPVFWHGRPSQMGPTHRGRAWRSQLPSLWTWEVALTLWLPMEADKQGSQGKAWKPSSRPGTPPPPLLGARGMDGAQGKASRTRAGL